MLTDFGWEMNENIPIQLGCVSLQLGFSAKSVNCMWKKIFPEKYCIFSHLISSRKMRNFSLFHSILPNHYRENMRNFCEKEMWVKGRKFHFAKLIVASTILREFSRKSLRNAYDYFHIFRIFWKFLFAGNFGCS